MTRTNESLAYEQGLLDAIEAIRQGRDDPSSGDDMRHVINWILGVAEGRIKNLIAALDVSVPAQQHHGSNPQYFRHPKGLP